LNQVIEFTLIHNLFQARNNQGKLYALAYHISYNSAISALCFTSSI